MKPTATYSNFDLKKGKCKCCGEESNEIVIDDGRCADCIEEENFFEQIMNTSHKKIDYGNLLKIWTRCLCKESGINYNRKTVYAKN